MFSSLYLFLFTLGLIFSLVFKILEMESCIIDFQPFKFPLSVNFLTTYKLLVLPSPTNFIISVWFFSLTHELIRHDSLISKFEDFQVYFVVVTDFYLSMTVSENIAVNTFSTFKCVWPIPKSFVWPTFWLILVKIPL